MSQQTMPPALWTIQEAKVFMSGYYLRPRARDVVKVTYSIQTWGDLYKFITSTSNTMTGSVADDLDEEFLDHFRSIKGAAPRGSLMRTFPASKQPAVAGIPDSAGSASKDVGPKLKTTNWNTFQSKKFQAGGCFQGVKKPRGRILSESLCGFTPKTTEATVSEAQTQAPPGFPDNAMTRQLLGPSLAPFGYTAAYKARQEAEDQRLKEQKKVFGEQQEEGEEL